MTIQAIDRPIWQLLDSSAIGGIETHVVALAPALRAAGYDAEVVLLEDHGPHPMDRLLADLGCPLRRLDGRLSTLIRTLRDQRPSVLHTHGYKAGILGRIAGRIAGIPTVSTFHNGDAGFGIVRLYTILDRISSRLSTRIAVNHQIAQKLPGPVTVVENGVPIPRHEPMGSGTSGTGAGSTGARVAFVGRLSYEKGPERFIELAARFPDLTFEMFGDGPMRSEISEEAGRVTVHGAVTTMEPHWSNIGLLVMPSRAEGLPMAALEAMARGIPVAAFDVGALSELTADDRGWISDAGDLDGLAAGIEAWSREDKSQRQSRSARNRTFIVDHYSVDRMVGAILKVYRDITA